MPPIILYDTRSQHLQLSNQLGMGGEGAVFEIVNQPGVVAKIYHRSRLPLPAEKADKLRAMVAMGSDDIRKVAAWPHSTLHDRPGGPVVGLLMARVTQPPWREVHFLYNMAERRTHFPRADWKFLVAAAHNVAAAFDELHKRGVVIGDVNQSNVLVSDQAGAFLIDCDSCQIRQGGTTYFCEVGVDLFTPPELQGVASFKGVLRTPDHDRFGLAVIIFQLLFMGRHPFAGRYTGPGDMQIDRAIREHRFAYAPGAQAYQMTPPPKSLTLDAVPPQLATLFLRAFTRTTTGRPAASEWLTALRALGTGAQRCSVHWGHYFAPGVQGCPWCRLMQQGAPDFFVTVVPAQVAVAGQPFNLNTAWVAIEQVTRPQYAYTRPAIPQPSPRPWPAHLPGSVPQHPTKPAILSNLPPQPPSLIARPAVQRVGVPRGQTQIRAGGASLVCGGCAAFFLFLSVLFYALAPASPDSHVLVVPRGLLILALCAALPACGIGSWWGFLELARRRREAENNQEYYDAQRQYRQAVKDERREWETRILARREEVRQQYNRAVAEWRKIIDPMKAEAERRRQCHRQADAAIGQAEKSWRQTADRITRGYDAAKAILERQRSEYQAVEAEYRAEHQRLQGRMMDLQLQQFLDQHLIADAEIENIKDKRKATLAAYGINSALDVEWHAISGVVPGFGDAYTSNLVSWRRSVERKFVFDPRKGIPAHEIQALEQKFGPRRGPLEVSLRAGRHQLQDIVSRGNQELQAVRAALEQRVQELEQAIADLRVIPANLPA